MRKAGLLFLFASLISMNLAQDLTPPDLVGGGEYPDPYWVSAEAAVTRDGDLDYSLFLSPTMKQYRQKHARSFRLSGKANRDRISWSECYQIERPRWHVPIQRSRPFDSFDALLRHSEAILEGTVVAITPGFLGGHHTSILTLRVESWLKKSHFFHQGPYVYMQYPVARFSVGGITYCVDNPDFPVEPVLGMRVLVFPYEKPWDEARMFFSVTSKMLFLADDPHFLWKPGDLHFDTVAAGINDFSGLVGEVIRRLDEPEITREIPQ